MLAFHWDVTHPTWPIPLPHPHRYDFIERANSLAEKVAPESWAVARHPLCAFVHSSRPFFSCPTVATACAALEACFPELKPALHAIARMAAAPACTPSDLLTFVRSHGGLIILLSLSLGVQNSHCTPTMRLFTTPSGSLFRTCVGNSKRACLHIPHPSDYVLWRFP